MDSKPTLPNRLTPPLTALLAVLAVLVVWKGFWPAWWTSGSDFAKYYTASRVVLEDEPFVDAYEDFIWFQKRMERAGVEGQVGGMIPHPPATALVMLPLAPLDPLTAKRVWTLVNAALSMLCVWLLARTSGLDLRASAAIFLATGVGLINNVLYGQLYLLLLASILAGVACIRRRPFWAGLCFGSLAPVKYVGGLYLITSAGKGRWRFLLGGAVAIAAVMTLTVWWTGTEASETFFQSVLGRHLAGEIQDPFASRFQTWNSLLRRLFVADPALNPAPALDSPWVFSLARNLVYGVLAVVWAITYWFNDLEKPAEKLLFGFGWISLGVLALSPGGATYHFLLLTIPTVFFCAILLGRRDLFGAAAFAALHAAINFPHYLHLESWTWGWWNVAAYSRLWLLTGYFALAAWRFGVSPRRSRLVLVVAAVIVLAPVATELSTGPALNPDGARSLFGPTLEGTLQLRAQPAIGDRRILFYCLDLRPGGKARVCGDDGGRLSPPGDADWYGVELGRDGRQTLAETIRDGQFEIWYWRLDQAGGSLAARGESPAWGPGMKEFAFLDRGRVLVKELGSANARLVAEIPGASALDWSETGVLAVASRDRGGSKLELLDPFTGTRTTLLRDRHVIRSPKWTEDGAAVLFSLRRGGGRDIWAVDVENRRLRRLTRDPANEDHPVWDEAARRILFSSDRGRGLGFPSLYWIPAPSELR